MTTKNNTEYKIVRLKHDVRTSMCQIKHKFKKGEIFHLYMNKSGNIHKAIFPDSDYPILYAFDGDLNVLFEDCE